MNIPMYYLREYFFPRGCGACGSSLLAGEEAFYGLCEACRDYFNRFIKAGEAQGECKICGKILLSEKETCLSCRSRETGRYSNHLVRVKTFFPYTGRFKNVLGAYKFDASLGLGNFFALSLTQSLKGQKPSDFFREISDAPWVPVPPRPGKIKKQGWDQIAFLSGLLVKRGIKVKACLKRLESKSQKELNKEERESNLKGRIICRENAPPRAVIFDDVITTGATLNACAEALMEGGAKSVYGIGLFYD